MPWVEISQAAFTMGISERTLRNWIKSGRINAKTENGQRLVEIPEEEFSGSTNPGDDTSGQRIDDVYGDDDNSNMLDTQKRLEVALLECGRVKGALSSQERIMETLSSNIAELTAKLQKAQNRTGRWIIAATVVAALAVLAVFVRGSLSERKLNETETEFTQKLNQKDLELQESKTQSQKERADYLQKLSDTKQELNDKMIVAIKEAEKERDSKHEQQLKEFKEEYRELLDKSDKALKEQRAEVDKKNEELIKLSQSYHTATEEVRNLKSKVADYDALRERYERLQKRYDELDAELLRERRKNVR